MENIYINGTIRIPELLPSFDKSEYLSEVLNICYNTLLEENPDSEYISVLDEIRDDFDDLHIDDKLDRAFNTCITIARSQAILLKRGDIVHPKCFRAINEYGEAIIHLITEYDIGFVFAYKFWNTPEDVELYFEVSEGIYSFNLVEYLTLGYDSTNEKAKRISKKDKK